MRCLSFDLAYLKQVICLFNFLKLENNGYKQIFVKIISFTNILFIYYISIKEKKIGSHKRKPLL